MPPQQRRKAQQLFGVHFPFRKPTVLGSALLPDMQLCKSQVLEPGRWNPWTSRPQQVWIKSGLYMAVQSHDDKTGPG